MDKKRRTRKPKKTEETEILETIESIETIETTPPDFKITWETDQNLYVLNSTMQNMNISGIHIENMVPTYIPPHQQKLLPADLFEKYDPSKNYNRGSLPILVQMPNTAQYVVGAIASLHKIRECFPTCRIVVQVRDDYKAMLPAFVEQLPVRTGRERFYRTFDFTESNLGQYWIDALKERSQPIHSLIMQSTGLYDTVKDKDRPVSYIDRELHQGSDYLIIHDGGDIAQSIIDEIIVKNIHLSEANAASISRARGVIFVGDSPFVHVSLFFKKKTMAFITKNAYKHQFQYKQYGDIDIYAYPDKTKLTSTIEEIKKFVGKGVATKDESTKTDFTRSYSQDTAE